MNQPRQVAASSLLKLLTLPSVRRLASVRRSGLAGTIILGSRRLDETRGIGAVPVRRLSPKPVLIRCGDRHVAAHSLHESVMLYALRLADEHPR